MRANRSRRSLKKTYWAKSKGSDFLLGIKRGKTVKIKKTPFLRESLVFLEQFAQIMNKSMKLLFLKEIKSDSLTFPLLLNNCEQLAPGLGIRSFGFSHSFFESERAKERFALYLESDGSERAKERFPPLLTSSSLPHPLSPYPPPHSWYITWLCPKAGKCLCSRPNYQGINYAGVGKEPNIMPSPISPGESPNTKREGGIFLVLCVGGNNLPA